MPVLNAEPVPEENPDLETGLLGAKLTTAGAANLLRIHPTTIYRMAKRGQLPGFKIGSDWRFDRVQLERWMRSRMQGP